MQQGKSHTNNARETLINKHFPQLNASGSDIAYAFGMRIHKMDLGTLGKQLPRC